MTWKRQEKKVLLSSILLKDSLRKSFSNSFSILLYQSNFSPKKKPVLYTKEARELPFDVKALSDGDLVRQLKSFGETPGPITQTTRQLYQKKLGMWITKHLHTVVCITFYSSDSLIILCQTLSLQSLRGKKKIIWKNLGLEKYFCQL